MDLGSYLKMTIPKSKQGETETYSCWHYGSEADQVKTCSISDTTDFRFSADEENYTTVILVLLIVPGLLALSTALWFILYNRRRRLRRLSGGHSEKHPMIKKKDKNNEVTETFKTFLLENVRKMYPNMPAGCYFVPPVYFNKVRYKSQCVVDQVVHIPDMPDERDVRHDRAMKHVLHCLRQIAEDRQENMFVLTQFSYKDI